MRNLNLPDDLESPNDRFFTHPVVEWFLTNAATQAVVDWDSFNGETIREKYEALYVKLTELTNILVRKGAKGYFWVVCNSPLCSVLEIATVNFAPHNLEALPLGYDTVMFTGVLAKKWRVYCDPAMKDDVMLVGAAFSKKPNDYYGKLTINNFIK